MEPERQVGEVFRHVGIVGKLRRPASAGEGDADLRLRTATNARGSR